MLAGVPGEDANLIEVEWQAVMGFGQTRRGIRGTFSHALVVIRDFVQWEKGDESLSLGVLRNVEGDIDVYHAG